MPSFLWAHDTSPLSGNGFFQLFINMIIAGQVKTLGVDKAFYLPSNPGHSYSLEFTTSGYSPTYLHLTVIDNVTGQQYAALDQVSDQAELQMAGQVGIQGAYGNNEWTGYSLIFGAGPHGHAKRPPAGP